MAKTECDQDVEVTIRAWSRLGQEDRAKLIPRFLNSIVDWRARSFQTSSQINWLENAFRDAGVPFIDSIASPDLSASRSDAHR
jgi:hypothetical protein